MFKSNRVVLPSEKEPILFYSNQTRDDLKRVIGRAFKQAQGSLEISIYSLSDPDILSLLEKKGDQSIPISIHYDAKVTTLPPSLASKVTSLPFNKKSLMHRKLFVIDQSLILLGSTNLTTTSLTMHDNIVIGLYHPDLGKALSQGASSLTFNLPNETGEIWLLPEKKQEALAKILSTINTAKKKIRLAMFTLTHPLLVDALIHAHERGIDVHCILDHYTAEGASKKAFQKLLAAGVTLSVSQGQQLLHHKWTMIDDKTLLVGSANWTRSAFTKNAECLMALSPLTKGQKKFMRTLWKKIKLEALQPQNAIHEKAAA